MTIRTHIRATVAAIALIPAVAFAQDAGAPTATTVVATVNGEDITLGQLIMLRAQLPAQYQQLPDEVIFDGLIDQIVNQQLLAETLDEEPARIAIALQNEHRSLRAGEVVNALAEQGATDEELQAAYDARFEGVEPDPEYSAAHILVETEEEAVALKEEIDAGADFAEMAREHSTGPSGPNGGDLGWFGPGMMVAPFEEAVVALEPGQVSDPVETQFGWHLIKLNDTRQQALPTLDEIRDELTGEIIEGKLKALLDELTAEADITLPEEGAFDYSIIQNLDLLSD